MNDPHGFGGLGHQSLRGNLALSGVTAREDDGRVRPQQLPRHLQPQPGIGSSHQGHKSSHVGHPVNGEARLAPEGAERDAAGLTPERVATVERACDDSCDEGEDGVAKPHGHVEPLLAAPALAKSSERRCSRWRLALGVCSQRLMMAVDEHAGGGGWL